VARYYERVAERMVRLAFTRAVGDALVAEAPELYTVAMPKAGREANILLDMLRNNRANTSVAAGLPLA
jgi:DNA primase